VKCKVGKESYYKNEAIKIRYRKPSKYSNGMLNTDVKEIMADSAIFNFNFEHEGLP